MRYRSKLLQNSPNIAPNFPFIDFTNPTQSYISFKHDATPFYTWSTFLALDERLGDDLMFCNFFRMLNILWVRKAWWWFLISSECSGLAFTSLFGYDDWAPSVGEAWHGCLELNLVSLQPYVIRFNQHCSHLNINNSYLAFKRVWYTKIHIMLSRPI